MLVHSCMLEAQSRECSRNMPVNHVYMNNYTCHVVLVSLMAHVLARLLTDNILRQ